MKLRHTCIMALFALMFNTTRAQSSDLPIGTIVAWAGNPANLDSKWKVCDGSQVSKALYQDLCAILGDYWGPINSNPAGAELFTLPDLRGMFLRGVNQGRNDQYKDPNADVRTDINGGVLTPAKSNQVGSYQSDAVQKHSHTYRTNSDGSGDVNGEHLPLTWARAEKSTKTTDEGGTGDETRPNNAYVYWIIKAK